MRPMLTAVLVAVVLLTAAFLFVVPTQERTVSGSAGHSGVRAAVAPNYYVTAYVSTEPVLPGYHDTLNYEVLNNTNSAPVHALSSIVVTGYYYNTGFVQLKVPGTPASLSTNPIGSWDFVVPANSTADIFYSPTFTIYANSSSLSMNQSTTLGIEVGSLEIYSDSVCNLVGACGTLTTGNPAKVSLNAQAVDSFGATSPASGETVKMLFYSTGSSPVTVPGVPASLTTDSQGNAAVTFTPSSSIFNVPGPDHVEIELTDSVNASLTVYSNLTFSLRNPVGTTNFAFWLNEATYYSGQTVTATWQWAGTNSTVGTLNVTNYAAFDSSTGNLIASGLIGSSSPTGTFSFALPATYYGTFYVDAFLYNASDSWELQAYAFADQAVFAAIPSELYFNPGDTITVTITEQGPALTGTTVSAFVQAYDSGQTLFNSTVSGGSFQFTVPAVAPAAEYRIAAWAATSTGVTVASDSEYVLEAHGYSFWAGISTASSYADGSFAPGQSVQLSYKVTPYGTSTAPTLQELLVFPGACTLVCTVDTPALKIYIVSSASGTVPFTIPSGTPNGLQSFNVVASWAGGSGASQVTVNVNNAPSALNYEIGAGSGLTVAWLILLILVVIVAFVILMMRRRGKPARMVMSPTSSTGSAPEWKEPSSTGGSSGGSAGGSNSGPTAPPGAQ